MSIVRESEAVWSGDLLSGSGIIKFGSKAFEGPYSFKTRASEQQQSETNPEELIGAAHAGCFSMALSAELTKAGFPPEKIHTIAKVKLEKNEGGLTITQINLETTAKVPSITTEKFLEIANHAKQNCPVSKALSAVPIELRATLD